MRGNRQTAWERIQNNDSKDDQMEKMQESINEDLEELYKQHNYWN